MKKDRKKELIKKSIALKYKMGEISPRIVSKGKGKIAEKIIEQASKYDITIIRDKEITDNLYRLEINDFIPYELFEVIASVYTFVMRKKEFKNEKEN